MNADDMYLLNVPPITSTSSHCTLKRLRTARHTESRSMDHNLLSMCQLELHVSGQKEVIQL